MINRKYLYKKIFRYSISGSLLLINPDLILEYINDKAQLLYSTYMSDKQSDIIKDIINEFNEIYKYDLKNADISEPYGIFDSDKDKKKFSDKKLFEFDFYMVIGNIFYNYMVLLLKNDRNIYNLDVPKTVIKYRDLYKMCINDLFSIINSFFAIEMYRGTRYDLLPKKVTYAEKMDMYGNPLDIKSIDNCPISINGEHAYFASYSLPTLIEYFLGINLSRKLMYSSFDKLKVLIDNKKINLNKEEYDLYNIFSKKGHKKIYKPENIIMKELYDMFVKYNVLDDNIDYEIILVGESKNKRRTIGYIINSNYAKKVIKKEYLNLIEWLFSTKYLNVRNNTMHGCNTNIDYFGICFPCIMLQLMWDIAKCSIFK